MTFEEKLMVNGEEKRAEGIAIGEAKGKAEGKAEGKEEIIWAMFDEGLNNEIIEKCARGYTKEQIAEMKRLWVASKKGS